MKAKVETGTPIQTKGAHHNYRKEFETTFKQLTRKHNAWQVWQDFVTMAAVSISNAVDKRPDVWQKREDEYMEIIKRYSPDDLGLFPKLLGYTTMALDTDPNQDFLGQLYMDLDFGSGWTGQFFTPYNVAKMMAKMQIGDKTSEELADGGYISVADPCCGAGVMLIAFANTCREDCKINYQRSVLFVAQDIDLIVAKMCYIQMSLLGLPGYVAVGDSLAKPVTGSDINPEYEADKLWYTPMFYRGIWLYRRAPYMFDESAEFVAARGNGKSTTDIMNLADATAYPEPHKQVRLKSDKKDILLAQQELSKLDQQKRAVKKFFKKGKEVLRSEIKSKNKNGS